MTNTWIERYVKAIFILVPIMMVLTVIFWIVVAILAFLYGPEFVGDFLQRAKDAYNE